MLRDTYISEEVMYVNLLPSHKENLIFKTYSRLILNNHEVDILLYMHVRGVAY